MQGDIRTLHSVSRKRQNAVSKEFHHSFFLDGAAAGLHEFLRDGPKCGYKFAALGQIAALFRRRDGTQERIVRAAEADGDDLDPVAMTRLGFGDRSRLVVPNTVGEYDEEARPLDGSQQSMGVGERTGLVAVAD